MGHRNLIILKHKHSKTIYTEDVVFLGLQTELYCCFVPFTCLRNCLRVTALQTALPLNDLVGRFHTFQSYGNDDQNMTIQYYFTKLLDFFFQISAEQLSKLHCTCA